MGFGQYSYAGSHERTNPLKNVPKKKRQRQVYPSSEIPHLWAHQTQEAARNAQGNFYFNGPVIYSYGSHFPIARHVTNARGDKAIVFTTRKYSVTTSGQMYAVRRAIPDGTRIFSIPLSQWSEGIPNHDASVKEYRAAIQEHYDKARKARYWGQWDFRQMIATRNEAELYAAFFDLDEGFPLPASEDEIEKLRVQVDEKNARGNAARDARYAKERAERERRCELNALKLADKIVAWRNGEPVTFGWGEDVPTMLRVRNGEVETSMGVRVPADHARKAYRLLKLVRAKGETYKRNGHTIYLGPYAIDSLDADGTLHAGCHHIKWDEVQRVGEQLIVDNSTKQE